MVNLLFYSIHQKEKNKNKRSFSRYVILIAMIYKNCHAIGRSGGKLVQVKGSTRGSSGPNGKGREFPTKC